MTIIYKNTTLVPFVINDQATDTFTFPFTVPEHNTKVGFTLYMTKGVRCNIYDADGTTVKRVITVGGSVTEDDSYSVQLTDVIYPNSVTDVQCTLKFEAVDTTTVHTFRPKALIILILAKGITDVDNTDLNLFTKTTPETNGFTLEKASGILLPEELTSTVQTYPEQLWR